MTTLRWTDAEEERAILMLDLYKVGNGLPGRQLVPSKMLPEGRMYYINGANFVGPLTFWSLTHDFRWPMLSRFSRGMLERDRDRRRQGKRR